MFHLYRTEKSRIQEKASFARAKGYDVIINFLTPSVTVLAREVVTLTGDVADSYLAHYLPQADKLNVDVADLILSKQMS